MLIVIHHSSLPIYFKYLFSNLLWKWLVCMCLSLMYYEKHICLKLCFPIKYKALIMVILGLIVLMNVLCQSIFKIHNPLKNPRNGLDFLFTGRDLIVKQISNKACVYHVFLLATLLYQNLSIHFMNMKILTKQYDQNQ